MPDSLEDKLKTVSAEVVTDEFQNGSESPAGDVSFRVRQKAFVSSDKQSSRSGGVARSTARSDDMSLSKDPLVAEWKAQLHKRGANTERQSVQHRPHQTKR